jgi:hypothetical protein
MPVPTLIALCLLAVSETTAAPRPLAELLLAERVSASELAELAIAFASPEYWNVSHAAVEVEAGRLVILGTNAVVDNAARHFGDPVAPGARLTRGLALNLGPGPARLRLGVAIEANELPAGALLAVGDVLRPGGAETAGAVGDERVACQVTCAAPFVACCVFQNGHPLCRCVHQGDLDVLRQCHAGGPGALSCRIEQPDRPDGPE